MHSKAIQSSSGCHVCFSFHDLPYQMVHPRTPLRFCSLHIPLKDTLYCIHSDGLFHGSGFLLCFYCMDEVCSSVGSILGDIHHPPSTPSGCTHPSSNFNLKNPPTWTVSMMGPLLHSCPIQPFPLPYWYHVRMLCKWNGLIPPTTITLSHRRRLHLDHGNPPFHALKARANHQT